MSLLASRRGVLSSAGSGAPAGPVEFVAATPIVARETAGTVTPDIVGAGGVAGDTVLVVLGTNGPCTFATTGEFTELSEHSVAGFAGALLATTNFDGTNEAFGVTTGTLGGTNGLFARAFIFRSASAVSAAAQVAATSSSLSHGDISVTDPDALVVHLWFVDDNTAFLSGHPESGWTTLGHELSTTAIDGGIGGQYIFAAGPTTLTGVDAGVLVSSENFVSWAVELTP